MSVFVRDQSILAKNLQIQANQISPNLTESRLGPGGTFYAAISAAALQHMVGSRRSPVVRDDGQTFCKLTPTAIVSPLNVQITVASKVRQLHRPLLKVNPSWPRCKVRRLPLQHRETPIRLPARLPQKPIRRSRIRPATRES